VDSLVPGEIYFVGRVEVEIQEGPLETYCWVWLGTVTNGGHPLMTVDGRHAYAHRLAYEKVHGEIQDGFEVHHLCKNTRCINPDHLAAHTLLAHRAQHRSFDYQEAAELWRSGLTYREVAEAMGVKRRTIAAAFERMRKRGEM